jgi:hypothetical protein
VIPRKSYRSLATPSDVLAYNAQTETPSN